jgi:hypothetical protein
MNVNSKPSANIISTRDVEMVGSKNDDGEGSHDHGHDNMDDDKNVNFEDESDGMEETRVVTLD